MVTILKHSKHWRVEVLKNELALFILADLVEIIDKQSLQQLVDKSLNFIAWDLFHDLFAWASFVDDSDEVLGESERNLLHRETKDVNHDLWKSIYKLVAQPDQSFLLHLAHRFLVLLIILIARGANHFV